jgi:hypothetical protein
MDPPISVPTPIGLPFIAIRPASPPLLPPVANYRSFNLKNPNKINFYWNSMDFSPFQTYSYKFHMLILLKAC